MEGVMVVEGVGVSEDFMVERVRRRWVLLPCSTDKPVRQELARTFNDDAITKLVQLSEAVVTNYGSRAQVAELIHEIRQNFEKWVEKDYEQGDEVYVILTGGYLHIAETLRLLIKHGINHKWLVYERKLGRYAIIDSGHEVIKVV